MVFVFSMVFVDNNYIHYRQHIFFSEDMSSPLTHV